MVTIAATARRRIFMRYVGPIALLVAATLMVLLVRRALETTETPTSAVKVKAVAQPRHPPPARPVRKRLYVIRSGDTLGAVAARYGTTVARLLALNPGLEPTALRIGRKIRIG